MEDDDMKHSDLVRKESRTSPEAGKGSSSHNTHNQGKDQTHERESSASEHREHQHQHHHHHQSTFVFPTRNDCDFFYDNCNDKL